MKYVNNCRSIKGLLLAGLISFGGASAIKAEKSSLSERLYNGAWGVATTGLGTMWIKDGGVFLGGIAVGYGVLNTAKAIHGQKSSDYGLISNKMQYLKVGLGASVSGGCYYFAEMEALRAQNNSAYFFGALSVASALWAASNMATIYEQKTQEVATQNS